ncbi:MAG: hypothetical protein FWD39_01715 [Clostridiales bacterium]|nr:hypothetical protein [Clostridiales bacterium]
MHKDVHEDVVKKYLSFLVEKYGMSYDHREFKDYSPGGLGYIATYSFCNKSGCFTIIIMPQTDDGVDYVRLDSIHSLKNYILWLTADNKEEREKHKQCCKEKQVHGINVFDVEPEIWEKYEKEFLFFKNLKNPFFGWDYRNIPRALAEVIETQIQKTGQFFGIKV